MNADDPVLFIPGWGMHSGVWGEALTQLAARCRVLTVDLPGYGAASDKTPTSHSSLSTHHLDAIVDQLSEQFTEPLTVCGWSLGGQIALRWAMREPQKIKRLILVAATPCFVQKPDWPCAMHADTLAAFALSLQQDRAATLRRFLALQMRGSDQEREWLTILRGMLKSRGEPDLHALQSGLEILRDADLRQHLPKIAQPALLIAGDRDTLTPLAAMQYLADQLPCARLAVIEGAAHAPFLSHAALFVKQVADFLDE